MINSDNQKQQFQARVQRIQTRLLDEQTGKAHPASRLVVGVTEEPKVQIKERRNIPFSGILAFVIGLAVVLSANVIAYQNSGVPGGFFSQILGLLGPLPIAGAMLFVIMIGLGMRDKPHVIGIALGLPLMYYGEPYMAWMAPDLWTQMYSADHVDTMLIRAGLRDAPMAIL